jgi:hypothetical protein
VWLYSSPTHYERLGFVAQRVEANGRLQATGVLPANARQFDRLLLTVETQPRTTAPGRIVLEGVLR